MNLAKVTGTVVSTRKEQSIEGLKFLIVQQVNLDGVQAGGFVVAADAVGAGVGEYVLYASGSSARQTLATDKRPCDAVIMAIVDNWEVEGSIKYKKGVDD
jgi:microcompartment protein CcmK/EutM